jgi:predicted DNA-binding protein with PD1-like motif
MRAKVINQAPERTMAVVLDTGEEVVSLLQRFAAEQSVHAGRITGIGAFQRATLGYFDWQRKEYDRIPVAEQVEVLSLMGDVALDGGEPRIHLHVVLGRRDGSTLGGHLLDAVVRPTLEVLLVDSPSYLIREHDPVSGLALIRHAP